MCSIAAVTLLSISCISRSKLVRPCIEPGQYSVKDKELAYDLFLESEDSFKLVKVLAEYSSNSCVGRYTVDLVGRTILLNCDSTESITDKLASNYMSQRTWNGQIKSCKTIVLNGQVLIAQ